MPEFIQTTELVLPFRLISAVLSAMAYTGAEYERQEVLAVKIVNAVIDSSPHPKCKIGTRTITDASTILRPFTPLTNGLPVVQRRRIQHPWGTSGALLAAWFAKMSTSIPVLDSCHSSSHPFNNVSLPTLVSHVYSSTMNVREVDENIENNRTDSGACRC